MLMDATVASGAAAMMAIRVLLDHDVPEENIFLLSLLMAVSGVHSIAYAFPKVTVVTTQVDPEVSDKFYIIPGIGMYFVSNISHNETLINVYTVCMNAGNYGDRFFGTEATAS